jgi:hypothetical protein
MRFSIRDLLWATALVAMGLGWWADSRSKAHKIECYDILVRQLRRPEENTREVAEKVHQAALEVLEDWPKDFMETYREP